MKTRYTLLLKLKKSELDRCERELQKANQALASATSALEEAYALLKTLQLPQKGTIQEMLSANSFIALQREIIEDKKNWVSFVKLQIEVAIAKLKNSHIEYEKFKYLDFEEIKKMLKLRAIKESKDLDEIALMGYKKREIS